MAPQSARKRLLDARNQNRLAARLRRLKEEDAFRHIRRLVALDAKVGLSLANRVLHQKRYLEQLFKEGLHSSNESTSRFWIEGIGPRIGAIRVVQLIDEQEKQEPGVVRRVVYWLPSLVKKEPKAKKCLDSLREKYEHATAS